MFSIEQNNDNDERPGFTCQVAVAYNIMAGKDSPINAPRHKQKPSSRFHTMASASSPMVGGRVKSRLRLA